MDANEITVTDDEVAHRFVFSDGGHEAELLYQVDGRRLILVHTEVPEAFRGRGLGRRLVQRAVDRAGSTGETIAPRCEYARKWLEDHSDGVAGVTIDWSEPVA